MYMGPLLGATHTNILKVHATAYMGHGTKYLSITNNVPSSILDSF